MERDAENDYLALDTRNEDPLSVLQGHSIRYRIALGQQAGRHRSTIYSAEIFIQETHSCDPDRRSQAPSGQMTGICLEKAESGVDERGFY